MAKNKYKEYVEPYLLQIEAWCRDGATDEIVYNNLNISKDSFYRYKKEHSEFCDALKRGKEVTDIIIENELYKNATGYYYTEEVGYKCKRVFYDEQGRRCEEEHVEKAEINKWKPGETGAQCFWLKNRKPKVWRDKHDIEHSGEVNTVINIIPASKKE